MMDRKETSRENTYRIRISGVLDRSIADWFGGITIHPQENGETILVGRFTDQPALRGFMDQLWNMNFTIVSVERIEIENIPDSNRRIPKSRRHL